ncbi:hypothetical protein PMAYCL1PPCAC_07625 [Pristionchus mayeri]|uniref:Uncharacterized protein n=1 Tax=Pristionchus mayeri TaxID=1317129 RepID=A0AAN5CB17_9BILA|nr:hypothetical protein PMAYCL1PPCAC_07625 [Pristionchus mayeri]
MRLFIFSEFSERTLHKMPSTLAEFSSQATITYDKCAGAKTLTYPDGVDFMRMITSHPTALFPLLIISCLVYLVVFVLGVMILRKASRIKDEQIRSDLYLCLSTPIVVSTICLQGMFFPKSTPGMSTISLAYVMFSLWRSVSLLFRMYGDVENMSALMYQTSTRLPLHSIPLCCCPCLPSVEPSVENIDTLKWFVLQTPVVRMVAVVVINQIRAEGHCETTTVTKILSWVSLASTLISVYSSAIFVKMSQEHIVKYRLSGIIRCTNLTQFMYSFLRFLVDELALNHAVFTDSQYHDGSVIEARVKADFWYNAILILILVPISISLNANFQPGKSALFEIEPAPFAGASKRPIIDARRPIFYSSTAQSDSELMNLV